MTKLYNDINGNFYGDNTGLNEKQQKFNAQCIVNFCKNSSLNWANESICALLGNMSFESSVNPQRNEVGGNGYGLVQWTPKKNLLTRAKKINEYNTYDTISSQMKVIEYEQKNNIQYYKTTNYPISFLEFITNSQNKSIEFLTASFLKNYERPLNQSQDVIDLRCNGDNNGHIGSLQWYNILNFSNNENSITKALKWAEKIANDDTYYYVFGGGHNVDFDSYKNTYFDCSSFISFALYNGGFDISTQFTTANQKEELKNLGFSVIVYKDKSQLKVGDILFYNNNGSGHTEFVYSIDNDNIKLVGSHNSDVAKSEQISICDFFGNEQWQYIARSGLNVNENIFNDEIINNNKERFFQINRKGMVFVYPRK